MTDLTEVMITVLAWVGAIAIGHIIGYRRGKRFYEKKYENCLIVEIEGWDWDE